MAGLLSLAFALPLPAHGGEGGYRLLELDGYLVKWGERELGVGASVSYAFADETLRFEDARNCRDLAPIKALAGRDLPMETLVRETKAAFRVWERASGLSFHEVGDARDADIVIGAQGRPRGRAFANVSYAPGPEEGVRAIEQALVCLNPDQEWKVGFDGNKDVYDIRYALIHEIGHAIGLDHPGPSGQVMAFLYTEAFNELQPGDLRGVQRLYGRGADDSEPANGLDTQLSETPTGGRLPALGRLSHHLYDEPASPILFIATE
ncbi:MAG: matrixin family metalloprotease [Ectothiorhodospiraceae bacterium]|nr:matrixin family metalloprotease [Ectothiorhodospiraceae bacterium]